MEKKFKNVLKPLYLEEFQCIAERCEDNCCIGWDVEFDEKCCKKYAQVQDKELSALFYNYVHENEECYDSEVDYASVKLLPGNICPFLNEQHLCRIQAKLGETSLSNVCATYPRSANEVDGVVEYSATLSCPEVARLALSQKGGIRFRETKEKASARKIIDCCVQTKQQGASFMVKHLKQLRGITITLLQDRNYSLSERILMLGSLYEKLQTAADSGKKDDPLKVLEDFSNTYFAADKKNDLNLPVEKNTLLKQYAIMKDLTDYINLDIEIDIQKYKDFLGLSRSGLGELNGKNGGEAYALAHAVYYMPFMEDNSYLLENYLVNFVFQELFPAGESTEPLKSYGMLVLRYSLIKFYLIGIAASQRGLTADIIIGFIQAFSKAVEHHHTYLTSLMDYMEKKGYDAPEQLKVLLGK